MYMRKLYTHILTYTYTHTCTYIYLHMPCYRTGRPGCGEMELSVRASSHIPNDAMLSIRAGNVRRQKYSIA